MIVKTATLLPEDHHDDGDGDGHQHHADDDFAQGGHILLRRRRIGRLGGSCRENEIKILTKFWVSTSFRRFGDRYDEFGYDSFTKSYQKSEIFLMVKFESA